MKAKRTKGKSGDLAALLPDLTRATFKSQGFASADVVLRWEAIAGSFAKFTRPKRIAFPRGERIGGALHLEVEGAYATELAHVAPVLIDRVNAYLGYGAVARLQLVHVAGLMARDPKPVAPASASAEAIAAFAADLKGDLDPEIRAALCRLAGAALAGK